MKYQAVTSRSPPFRPRVKIKPHHQVAGRELCLWTCGLRMFCYSFVYIARALLHDIKLLGSLQARVSEGRFEFMAERTLQISNRARSLGIGPPQRHH
ncbi:hypothetical protein PoB_004680900 [Plakobranchus ocellatus]|uniref:Uncharacterized protein n=1 Tax=Plakobranchus ocellatus TaxID=259542 RepID=A0AAV4BN45_9GAST|nr:hypothetical protein PoB_004680900 [Plakobranchus ocellatus]